MIIVADSAGTPQGVYSVSYYTVRGGRVCLQAGGDSNITAAGARMIAARLGPREVMVACCDSQPGGFTAFGSEHAQRVWHVDRG